MSKNIIRALAAAAALATGSMAAHAQQNFFKVGVIEYTTDSKTNGIHGAGVPPGADAVVMQEDCVAQDDGTVRFAVWAPNARGVEVIGDFNGWTPEALAPQGSSGVWAIASDSAEPGHRYKYLVHGADGRTVLKADPMAQAAEMPPSDASIVAGRNDFAWGDDDWLARRAATVNGERRPLRVYEVHLGSWRFDLRDYRAIADSLADHVSSLGFTHVELLPVMEHPFYGSWGYQVTGYFAPTGRYGTPDDLMAMIDTLHQAGVGVIVDWVPAHFPTDAHGLGRFDGTHLFEHADPRRGFHPDWTSYIFNYARHEVRAFLADTSADKRAKKVDELLASPGYAAWWTTRPRWVCCWPRCTRCRPWPRWWWGG